MIEFRLPFEAAPMAGTATETVVYRSHDIDDRGFNRTVSSISVPTLFMYPPEHVGHRGAAIVICPGGGYEYLAIDRGGHALARFFQTHGLTAFVLKYRLPSPPLAEGAIPLSQHDANSAMQFVRGHASTWGLNPRRIGILGTSAGGHLAGSTAIAGRTEDGTRPDFAVLLSAVVTLTGPFAHRVSRERLLGVHPPSSQLDMFSLERQVRSGLPAFFLAHARDDTVVPPDNTQLLADALRRHGVEAELLFVPQGGHSFSGNLEAPGLMWPERFLRWLDTLP